MSDKPKFPLEMARPVADELIEMLAPFCLPGRIIAAGSLRRLKPLGSNHFGSIFSRRLIDCSSPREVVPSFVRISVCFCSSFTS